MRYMKQSSCVTVVTKQKSSWDDCSTNTMAIMSYVDGIQTVYIVVQNPQMVLLSSQGICELVSHTSYE